MVVTTFLFALWCKFNASKGNESLALIAPVAWQILRKTGDLDSPPAPPPHTNHHQWGEGYPAIFPFYCFFPSTDHLLPFTCFALRHGICGSLPMYISPGGRQVGPTARQSAGREAAGIEPGFSRRTN